MYFSENHFQGSIDLACLPVSSSIVAVAYNRLSGPVNLQHLPEGLTELWLENNCFEASVDLHKLPLTMEQISLCHNQFSGAANLSNLPSTLYSVNLAYNAFTGTPDLRHLPSALQELRLDNNEFSGHVYFDRIPVKLTDLTLHNNEQLEGNVTTECLSLNISYTVVFSLFYPPPTGLVFCSILEIFCMRLFFDPFVPNPRSFSLVDTCIIPKPEKKVVLLPCRISFLGKEHFDRAVEPSS